MLRPSCNDNINYYQSKIMELNEEYKGKGMNLDNNYFIRLNAYRDAIKYNNK
jgi:hypothetical protein